MAPKLILPSPTHDDLTAAGYMLFPEQARLGTLAFDVWERPSHKGEGWQYLVGLKTPDQGLRVLNAEAPLDRMPEVTTLENMLVAAKVLDKPPAMALRWAACLKDTDVGGEYTAERFRSRAMDEMLVHRPFSETDDCFETYSLHADGTECDDSRDIEAWEWIESGSPGLCEKTLGSLKFLLLADRPMDVNDMLKNDLSEESLAAPNGRTALHFCAWLGREMEIALLVDAGFDLHAVDDNGHTPLHFAAAQGHDTASMTLYEMGADPLKVNALGQNPLEMGMAAGKADDMHLLRTLVSSLSARAVLTEMLQEGQPVLKP